MDRIVGVETEYGCLMSSEELRCNSEVWPAKVKNYLFNKARAGTIDLHYRDYEEPPGNGGFLLNGGRLYLDMGHIEYASPECLHLHDLVTYEMAGDELLRSSLVALEAGDRVTFIKNNVDHHTGATFGCHENYLMKREAQFTPSVLGTLLTFLATRQIFTGAGRVGQANPLAFDFEPPQAETPVAFQLSQRADHIVNDIYQWVQFNRAIINARDEPLADYRKYRRLHLLIGDSNMSPFANALKIGTTAVVLSLLEQRQLPRNLVLNDAVRSTRDISRDPTLGRSLAAKFGSRISQHRSDARIILQRHPGQTRGRMEQQFSTGNRDSCSAHQHARIRPRSRRRLFSRSTSTLRHQLGLHRARQPRLSRHGRSVRNLQHRSR